MPFSPYTPLSQETVADVPPSPSQSPSTAPKFTKHRVGLAAVDAAAVTDRRRGMNMSGYDNAIIRVIPTNGADPDIEVLFWSEEADQFVADATGLTATGKGANIPYDYKCEVNNRIIFVYVTGTLTGANRADILIAGHLLDRQS